MVPERLAIREINAGEPLYRCHSSHHGAIYFGRQRQNRFDDPKGQFGVCYLALSPGGAFAETLIRKSAGQVLQKSDLKTFCLSRIEIRKTLRLVHCHGEGLKHNGLDSRISSRVDRYSTQQIACTFHDHENRPDGLIYRAHHDDDQLSVTLFERASGKLAKPHEPIPWIDTGPHLDEVLDRCDIALIDG